VRSEENTPKNGKPTVGFFLTIMLQHTSVLVKEFLAKNNVTTLEYSPHSPNLTPADLFLFPRLKSSLKGLRFCDATDIIKNATEELKRVSQNVFQEYFEHLYSHWH